MPWKRRSLSKICNKTKRDKMGEKDRSGRGGEKLRGTTFRQSLAKGRRMGRRKEERGEWGRAGKPWVVSRVQSRKKRGGLGRWGTDPKERKAREGRGSGKSGGYFLRRINKKDNNREVIPSGHEKGHHHLKSHA